MGILAWLDRQFGEYPHQPRPAVHKPPPPKKPSDISEPVISLIESLGRDEWELSKIHSGVHSRMYHTVLTHVFHESLKLRQVHYFSYGVDDIDHTLEVDWATVDEKKLLTEAFNGRVSAVRKLDEQHRQANARNKFMILVKDNNEQT